MIGGRLFGETISGRYDATDLIDNPVMVLEYIKRQQNWNAEGSALIKTSGVGAFDDSSLDEIKALSIARQVTSENQQWSDALSQSLCEVFYLISRQDADGYECVHYLMADTTPEVTVDIGDIIPGTLGKIEEPNPEYIFVEPYIKYGYDYAREGFTRTLSIIGTTTESAWSADLTPGFSGTDGEALWNVCRSNYLKYGKLVEMPTQLSEQMWIPTYATALWKFTKMLEWQQKCRFSFSVPYIVGRSWYLGMQMYIQFPNETDDQAVRAVITSFRRHKNQNSVAIELVILDNVETAFYYQKYQMTDTASTEWQATDGAETLYQEQG